MVKFKYSVESVITDETGSNAHLLVEAENKQGKHKILVKLSELAYNTEKALSVFFDRVLVIHDINKFKADLLKAAEKLEVKKDLEKYKTGA